MSKGKEFRQLLASEPYVYTSGVYSPIQARIAEAVGLKCAYMSGYSVLSGLSGAGRPGVRHHDRDGGLGQGHRQRSRGTGDIGRRRRLRQRPHGSPGHRGV